MSELARKVERVRVLLESLHDPYLTLRGSLEPDSGPAPSRYVPCETCGRRGEVRVRGGKWRLCLACDGTGWHLRQAGEAAWDAYVELPLVEAVALPREQTSRRPIPANANNDGYAWERARRAYDAHGSYKRLRRELSRLAYVSPRRHRLVVAVHVEHEALELGPPARLELELGVLALALRLGRVRVPPWLMEPAETRRSSVAELAAAGLGAGAIARELGIPKGTVRKYLAVTSDRSSNV